MGKQIIIAIGREYGSGGLAIGEAVAKKLNITLYDKNILEKMEEAGHIDAEIMRKFDEKPSNPFFTRHMRGVSSSMEENLAIMQFCFLREKAEAGESFVVVGRCAEEVLKDNPNAISVFIRGNMDDRIKRVMERDGLDEKKAAQLIKKTDAARKQYHDSYCDFNWGEAKGYDFCINSTILGEEKTADIICEIVNRK